MPLDKTVTASPVDLYRSVFDSALEGLFAIDRDGMVTLCNAPGAAMLGFAAADEATGLHMRRLMARKDWRADDCDILKAAEGHACHQKVGRFRRRDGSDLLVEYRAAPLRQDGRLIGATCSFIDISEREASRAQGEDARRRVDLALAAGALAGVWEWDCERQLVFGDARYLQTLGLSDAACTAQGLSMEQVMAVIHPDDRDRIAEAVARDLDGDGPCRSEYRILRPDGSWRWVEASGVVSRDRHGQALRFSGILIDTHERRQAEQALNEAHNQLRLAQRAGGVVGMWVWDLPRQLVTGDEGFASAFGIAPEAAKAGVPFADMAPAVHPDDLPRLEAAVQKALQGELCQIAYRVRDGDDWRWIDCTGKAEMDENGAPVSLSGVMVDIDARRRIERALNESHQHLRMAQAAGGIGVFVVPTGSDDMQVSDEFCRLFGLPPTDRIPVDTVKALVLPEDTEARSTRADRAEGATPSEAEYRIRRADDGEMRWIYRRGEFVRDERGRPSHMLGIVQDITGRKLAALRLKESQDYFKLMLDSVQDHAIITLDQSGRIVLWNPGAQEIFGYKAAEAVGQGFELIFTDEDRAAAAPRAELAAAAIHGRTHDERWHQRHNGQRFYASGSLTAMRDDEGRVCGFIKIARDMTEQQRAQQALMEARNAAEAASLAKSEFLANMSHEIRTPMNAIIGLSTILAKSQPLTQRQDAYIRTLQTSADTLLALINDLLDIARIEARSIELEHIPFTFSRLGQEIGDMLGVLARDKGLALRIDDSAVAGRAYLGDPTRLRQIVMNLGANAVKFTESGEVEIVFLREAMADGRDLVRIRVRDTGVGIAPDKIDEIFQKFTQADSSINRKYGGAGLGLAITRTLCDIMGGDIRATSRVGEGSVFEATAPFAIADAKTVAGADLSLAARAEQSVAVSRQPRILLVEDHEPNVVVASAFLEEFGFAVDLAASGREAYERLADATYAAVLMDVQMHDVNGLDATRMIREREAREGRAPVRIIGMTAHALAGDRERCLEAGMDDYISKPFRPEMLKTKLTDA
ncbi:MAG TPA: PAS domain S-box protein [Asticcacaulis sp.]|nr:PAS domain S-box protein [Asticcacaulis sp.]